MAYQRRGKKGTSHDIINVTDLDNDLEEFSLSSVASPSKSKTQSTTTIGHVGATTATTANGHLKTNYSDPLQTKTYKDPLQTMSVKDPFADNRKPNLDRGNKTSNSSLKLDSDSKRNATQSASPGQTGPKGDAVSTQNVSHVTQKTPMRGLTSTPSNHPVTSIHITKRYTATPRVDKNKKGFSHEEKDLYIDDIEDF